MSFSPVKASIKIVDKYMRYLSTIFSIDNSVYNRQLQVLLSDRTTFASGPFLDVTDSFKTGKSIEELISIGLLSKNFKKINIPLSRPLYMHQERALEKAIGGSNLIVSTGTGSGKTESFMLPILNSIMREHEAGTLDSGVRALLIYPMNALANDQIERLRDLLKNYPEITFGSYTGQTKHTEHEALADYKQLNENSEPLVNELISREAIKKNPPNILITNYAMLEYLMLRPDDSIFFERRYAHKWKYIVLDEAHVYNGGSGIEVAMLLRRLKTKLHNDRIQYILTSATLGDKLADKEVADFGTNLCNSTFGTNDIIRADRIVSVPSKTTHHLDITDYKSIATLIEEGNDADLYTELLKYPAATRGINTAEILYNLVLHDDNYIRIKDFLQNAKTIKEIANEMSWKEEEVSAFVTVASKAERNGSRLFDARYHMFIRATESAFITLQPSSKLFLTRKKVHIETDGIDYKVFEIATCSVCHAIYLIGAIKNNVLEQSSFQSEDNLRSVFLLKDSVSDTDEDHSQEEENIETEEYEICARCGFVRKASGVSKPICEHGNTYMVKAYKVDVKSETGSLTKCPACENTNSRGILRMLFSGQEAVTSVLGTALFEELPSYKNVTSTVSSSTDDFGFGDDSNTTLTTQITEAKQFISFSDSRQAAAFFASYFDQTYQNILYKRLIVETLKSTRSKNKSVDYFTEDLEAQFEKYKVYSYGGDSKREAWKAIIHEIVDINGVTSLSNTGLVAFEVDPSGIGSNSILKLSKDDVIALCSVLLIGLFSDAAICYSMPMTKADREFFTHNGIEYSYTLSDPDPKAYRRSFIPRFTTKTNKRADYLSRVLKKNGFDFDNAKVNSILSEIWNKVLVNKGYVIPQKGVYKVNTKMLRTIVSVCPDEVHRPLQ